MQSLDWTRPTICRTCYSRVTRAFSRTFGDRDDVVHRCGTCDTTGRLERGSAAGVNVPEPDPLDNPGRMPDTPSIPQDERSSGGAGE